MLPVDPLRGTIIYGRHFENTGHGVRVSASRGKIGPRIEFSLADLRSLSVVLVPTLKYLQGDWQLEPFREKRLRYELDKLRPIHRRPAFGQMHPAIVNARHYILDNTGRHAVDLRKMNLDAARARPEQDVMVDLRIVAVATDGGRARAFLVPWEHTSTIGPQWTFSIADLSGFEGPVPGDVDPAQVAQQLNQVTAAVN